MYIHYTYENGTIFLITDIEAPRKFLLGHRVTLLKYRTFLYKTVYLATLYISAISKINYFNIDNTKPSNTYIYF